MHAVLSAGCENSRYLHKSNELNFQIPVTSMGKAPIHQEELGVGSQLFSLRIIHTSRFSVTSPWEGTGYL